MLKRFDFVEFDHVSTDIIRRGPNFEGITATLHFIERATEGKLSREMFSQYLEDE